MRLLMALAVTGLLSAGAAPAQDVVLGVFEGRTPCGAVANGFTGFPSVSCEKIKWELTLSVDANTRTPTTWRYRGTRTERAGRWEIARGTATNPDAVVYRLRDDSGETVLELQRADSNVLLIMGRDRKVLVGDASWSYVLNRTDVAGVEPQSRPGLE